MLYKLSVPRKYGGLKMGLIIWALRLYKTEISAAYCLRYLIDVRPMLTM